MRARVTLVLLLAAATANADSSVPNTRAPSTAADRELARRLFTEGVQLYDAARFADAALKFERAYQTLPMHAVLFNIGQARRLNNDPAAAVQAYRAYLRDAPTAPHRAEVEKLIADLDRAPK